MKLIQETHCSEQWQIPIACILLNNKLQAESSLSLLLKTYPTLDALASADQSDLERIIGVANRTAAVQRAVTVLKTLPAEKEEQLKALSAIPVYGETIADAWRMIVYNDTDFWPQDKMLGVRMGNFSLTCESLEIIMVISTCT